MVYMLHTSVNLYLTRIGASAEQLKQGAVINGDVDLDEMDYDEITGTFSLPCRCSGSYSIREQDMENGVDIASCDNCSLIIRVLYDVVEDDEWDRRRLFKTQCDVSSFNSSYLYPIFEQLWQTCQMYPTLYINLPRLQ